MKLPRLSHRNRIPAARWRANHAPARRAAPNPSRAAPAPGNALRDFMHDGLNGLAPDSVVLAIGCEGTFLAPQLAEYSGDVTVLDSSAAEIAQVARRFPEIAFLQHEPASRLPFARETFDAIWCCEFLDHVFDPLGALREMHRVLLPGGRLLITVPDHGPWRKVLLAFFKADEGCARVNPPIHHFTKPALARVVRAASFTEVQISTAGPLRRSAAGTAPRRLLLQAKKGRAIRLGLVETRRTRTEREIEGAEELAFASRVRPAA